MNGIKPLADLEYISYLTDEGTITPNLDNKIGVYAIFNSDRVLQYVGYSRNIGSSLRQHLVRQPHQCYWLKVETIERPNRTILDSIRTHWLAENRTIPPGNGEGEANWTQPIDAKKFMTEEEKQAYQQIEEIAKVKLLKKVARRVEKEVMARLESRNIKMEFRFNPKLKEQGLLDLTNP